MDVETIIAVLSSLGIGGFIGSYLQHLWNQKQETESKMQNLNVGHYSSTLVFMRVIMDPLSVAQFHIEDPNLVKLKDPDDVKIYAYQKMVEFYYSSLLYSPDEVLATMKEFMAKPTETNFMKSAIAMRKDLWKKKTKANLESLSLDWH
jgi:hypothetical protein